MASSERTIDHDTIRKWVESRGGTPSRVRDTDSAKGPGILRFDFGEKDASLEPVSWEEFFETFEDHHLALLYQEETEEGNQSRFNKLVSRSSGDEE